MQPSLSGWAPLDTTLCTRHRKSIAAWGKNITKSNKNAPNIQDLVQKKKSVLFS